MTFPEWAEILFIADNVRQVYVFATFNVTFRLFLHPPPLENFKGRRSSLFEGKRKAALAQTPLFPQATTGFQF